MLKLLNIIKQHKKQDKQNAICIFVSFPNFPRCSATHNTNHAFGKISSRHNWAVPFFMTTIRLDTNSVVYQQGWMILSCSKMSRQDALSPHIKVAAKVVVPCIRLLLKTSQLVFPVFFRMEYIGVPFLF